MYSIKKIALTALLALAAALVFAQNESAGVERYGLYIGSNDGGKNHERLLYAGTDAIAFQKIMNEIGGISKSNGILLLDPAKEDVDNAFEIISAMMEKKQAAAKRSEFVFYYSGHSDENALLLGKTKYDYSSLKASITNVPSDVHVVILDSCFSGNFIRTKGGSKQKPFLVDDSSVVKGHAYLSSSSSQESSQESDEIGSSFFTNAMITGLRGAADTSGDKKVTLNELYSYAFNETLSKTENTADPQHPNYNITLVGSGDLVLSDVSASDCILTISRELTGRVIVRDKNGKLVSEVNKTAQTPIYLALEAGQYGVTVIGELSTLQGNFVLGQQKNYALSAASLSPIARAETRSRGSEAEEAAQEESAASDESENGAQAVQPDAIEPLEKAFVFSFVCNEFERVAKRPVATNFSLALLRSRVFSVNGAMIGGIGNEARYVNGGQAAYVYNIAQEVKGVQLANTFNFSQTVLGVQGAGIINFARDMTGLQAAGIANVSRNFKYFQGAGIMNVTTESMTGIQGAGIANIAVKEARGFQGAGIANIAAGNVTGLQAAAIANIATGDVKGAQIGLFNFCKGDCGFQLGLINYSRNGVFEIGASYSTDEKIRLALNTGGKHLYTILGGYADPHGYGNNDTQKTACVFMGLGTRVELWKFNFDFEAIVNGLFVVNIDKSADKYKLRNVKCECYPTTRVSAGFTPIKHLNVFAAAALSYGFSGNEGAFAIHNKNMVINAGSLTLYPEFDFGLKFSVN